MFRDYGGVKLLCELFVRHKDLSIANALAHVVEDFCSLDENAFGQINYILDVVREILSDEDPCERTAEGLLNFLLTLNNKDIPFTFNEKLLKILGAVANKFIENKHICTKALRVFANALINKKAANGYIEAGLIDTTRAIMEAHSSDPKICRLGCEVLAKVLALANRNCNNTPNTDKMTHDTIFI